MKTALIIEDQPSNREILCLLLRMNGFQVIEASTGEEAIKASNGSNGCIDLVLCDLMLPDLSGASVARELARSHSEAAILLISGTPEDNWSNEDLDSFRQIPAQSADFLEKPFFPTVLTTKIDALLKRRSDRSETFRSIEQ